MTMGNSTTPGNTEPINISGLTQLATLWKILSAFGVAQDWIKLFLLGTVLETVRRFAYTIWYRTIDSFFLTATFESDDDAYSWLMVWVSRQPNWRKARDVQVSTRSWGLEVQDNSTRGIMLPGEAGDPTSQRPLHLLPSFGLPQTFWYKGHWMRLTRSRRAVNENDNIEVLTISILARSQRVLYDLLTESKRQYQESETHRVSIYTVGPYYNDWRRSGSRPKRPLDSVVLEHGLKEMVLHDAQEFINSEAWYAARGLPWRRGYLLYGVPGSGKTSLVFSIAGELNLDIYVINLGKRGLDDSGLTELVSELPPRSIALIEEIDAVFTRGLNRETSKEEEGANTKNSISLGGLLSAIDGIQASEGRLLFATTNNYNALDPALIRAGRLDVHVEFTEATQFQVEELFKRFFWVTDGTPKVVSDAKPLASSTSRYVRPQPEELTKEECDRLASEFAARIPNREFAMSSIQGFLLMHKYRPSQVVKEVDAWVEKERAAKRERERAKASQDSKGSPKDPSDSKGPPSPPPEEATA